MNNPLLSIIVPTHNRARYAKSCITSILNEVKGDFELIIHDTSESDELETFAKTISDPRLRYFKTVELLSMTENHNKAFTKATGKYLCLIGDDDTVAVNIIDVCQWADQNNFKIVNHKMGANYIWPDFISLRMGNRHSSRLYIQTNVGNSFDYYSSSHELGKAFHRAFQGVEDLPKIYHGIVRADQFAEIKKTTGEYFFGASPDISAAILLANHCEEYVVTTYPFTIPGASGGSNTGRSAVGKHKGDLKTDPHTKRFKNLVWPDEVPEFFSVETVWLQAAIETLKIVRPDDVKKINFPYFYSLCLIRHHDYMENIKDKIRKYSAVNGAEIYFSIPWQIVKIMLQVGSQILKRLLKPTAAGGKDLIENIPTLDNVPTLLKDHLDKKHVFFNFLREANE